MNCRWWNPVHRWRRRPLWLRWFNPIHVWRARPLWMHTWWWQDESDWISETELDRRLRAISDLALQHTQECRDRRANEFVAALNLAVRRGKQDMAILTAPLPPDTDDAQIDQWCAALFRELVRRRHLNVRDIHSTDIHEAIHRVQRWLRGLPLTRQRCTCEPRRSV